MSSVSLVFVVVGLLDVVDDGWVLVVIAASSFGVRCNDTDTAVASPFAVPLLADGAAVLLTTVRAVVGRLLGTDAFVAGGLIRDGDATTVSFAPAVVLATLLVDVTRLIGGFDALPLMCAVDGVLVRRRLGGLMVVVVGFGVGVGGGMVLMRKLL